MKKHNRKMLNFIGRRFTGSIVTIKNHRKRSILISEAINERFNVNVYQYQLKHYKWLLAENNKHLNSSTQYNYWLTVKKLIALTQKTTHWEPLLQGAWVRPK